MRLAFYILIAWCGVFFAAEKIQAQSREPDGTRILRFVQDDAQDYMVSKLYLLKYTQANDLNPFVSGMIKRYNMNSIANCIQYPQANQEILTVTCPVGMMPYVDQFIALADRPVKIDGKVPGDIVKGTGITRAVYQPQYRSGQILVNVIVNAIINAGPYGSVYGWDENSNQIYWKDNTSNTDFMYQFLAFLDRPAPQIALTFRVYEVRESTLRDIGIDYLAWKNGPGLDLFKVGWQALDLSSSGSAAITAMSGTFGGFFFAPQFDASFIRILEQNGKAAIQSTAGMTVSNTDTLTYEVYFNPQLQNIIKSDNDQAEVTTSTASAQETSQVYLQILQPTVCIHSGTEVEFSIPNYEPGQYAKAFGTLFFGYNVQVAGAVERNTYGSELVETTAITGNASMELNREQVLCSWDKTQEVRQTIGVPFLCEIPVLKYLFSTTTTSTEKTHLYLTMQAEILNTIPGAPKAGLLSKIK